MDLKRELVAAIERHNPDYLDGGQHQLGTRDSVLNEVVQAWGILDEQSRAKIDSQLVDLLRAPLVAPRDYTLVSTASKLCGRLNVIEGIEVAYQRLKNANLPLSGPKSDARDLALALFNLIVSQAGTAPGGAALSSMMLSGAVPANLFALTFQGYLRRHPLSFSQAVRAFVADIGDRLEQVDWDILWRHSGGAIDLGVLGNSLKDLPIQRFPTSEEPNAMEFSWLIRQLFGRKKSPLVLRQASDDTDADRSGYIVERVVTWRGRPPTVSSAQLLSPAGDQEEYVRFAPFRKALGDAIASRVAEEHIDGGMDDQNLNKVISFLAPKLAA